jgi:7-cyano-7-deazaguanine reductase
VAEYTEEHAKSGVDAKLPGIECWPNQFPGYEITITVPEFTSICPRTGLPDFGVLTILYEPDARCLELKSLREYFLAYRNLGIFYENVVNRVLGDLVAACAPVRLEVAGEFSARGGMRARVRAWYPREAPLSTRKSSVRSRRTAPAGRT